MLPEFLIGYFVFLNEVCETSVFIRINAIEAEKNSSLILWVENDLNLLILHEHKEIIWNEILIIETKSTNILLMSRENYILQRIIHFK